MSLALRTTAEFAAQAVVAPARVALLGTGTVGSAVLARLASWEGTRLGDRVQLVHVANSRCEFKPSPIGRGWRPSTELRTGCTPGEGTAESGRNGFLRTLIPTPLPAGEGLDLVARHLCGQGTCIVVDATASDEVAAQHAHWLALGLHVVTACKLGQGTSLQRAHAIRAACAQSGAHYGDAATVGAGLPLLRTIRALNQGGDRIHAIAGVLSGSLAWLFSNYDGMCPFSSLVGEARERGYTEPDPREDLSGEDVRRKLLILARAAGHELDPAQVAVESLVPRALAVLSREAALNSLDGLDAALRERFQRAHREGRRLRFIARLDESGARVGLESLSPDDPLAQGGGCDNRVAIWSDRYAERPLLIQGPGAGAEVTAAALLDDVLEIVRAARAD